MELLLFIGLVMIRLRSGGDRSPRFTAAEGADPQVDRDVVRSIAAGDHFLRGIEVHPHLNELLAGKVVAEVGAAAALNVVAISHDRTPCDADRSAVVQ